MSMLRKHNILVLSWIGAVLGLFAMAGSPLTFSTGWLLLFGVVVPPTIWIILSRAPRITLGEAIAEESRPQSRGRTE